MPDISYSVSLRIEKGYLSSSLSANNVSAAMSVAGAKSDTYLLSSSPTNISTANLSVAGLAFLRNLATATSATCQIGVVSGATFVPFATLRAGEPAVIRLASNATYQATGAANTRLRVDITEG